MSRVELLLQVGTFCVAVGALVAGLLFLSKKETMSSVYLFLAIKCYMMPIAKSSALCCLENLEVGCYNQGPSTYFDTIFLIAGIFGMNLKSYLEEHVVCCLCISLTLSLQLLTYSYFLLSLNNVTHVMIDLMQFAFWLTTAGIIVGAVVGFFLMYWYLKKRKVL